MLDHCFDQLVQQDWLWFDQQRRLKPSQSGCLIRKQLRETLWRLKRRRGRRNNQLLRHPRQLVKLAHHYSDVLFFEELGMKGRTDRVIAVLNYAGP